MSPSQLRGQRKQPLPTLQAAHRSAPGRRAARGPWGERGGSPAGASSPGASAAWAELWPWVLVPGLQSFSGGAHGRRCGFISRYHLRRQGQELGKGLHSNSRTQPCARFREGRRVGPGVLTYSPIELTPISQMRTAGPAAGGKEAPGGPPTRGARCGLTRGHAEQLSGETPFSPFLLGLLCLPPQPSLSQRKRRVETPCSPGELL